MQNKVCELDKEILELRKIAHQVKQSNALTMRPKLETLVEGILDKLSEMSDRIGDLQRAVEGGSNGG